MSQIIDVLKSKRSYKAIIELIVEQYTFSSNEIVKSKAEEYLALLKFDMSKIDEVLY